MMMTFFDGGSVGSQGSLMFTGEVHLLSPGRPSQLESPSIFHSFLLADLEMKDGETKAQEE